MFVWIISEDVIQLHLSFFSDTRRYVNLSDITQAVHTTCANWREPGPTRRDAARCGAGMIRRGVVRCGAPIGWMNVGRENERGVVLARRSITSKAFFSSFFYYTPLAPLKSLVSRRTIGWTNENPLDQPHGGSVAMVIRYGKILWTV